MLVLACSGDADSKSARDRPSSCTVPASSVAKAAISHVAPASARGSFQLLRPRHFLRRPRALQHAVLAQHDQQSWCAAARCAAVNSSRGRRCAGAGPVFLFAGGEMPLEVWQQFEYLEQLAQSNQAALAFVEHRYYGASISALSKVFSRLSFTRRQISAVRRPIADRPEHEGAAQRVCICSPWVAVRSVADSEPSALGSRRGRAADSRRLFLAAE